MKPVLRLALAAATIASFADALPVQAGDFMVTLLGTASPAPRPDRSGPSTLIEAGDRVVPIHAGRNVPFRLWQLKVPVGRVDATILTHFHSNHTSGLPDIWLTGWIGTPYGGCTAPFPVIGPTGTRALTDGIQTAFDADVQIRMVDKGNPPAVIEIDTTEFAQGGVIFDKGGLKITAFETGHGEHIRPNYGIVAEYDGRKMVMSDDATFDSRIAEQGRGADLLIHELGTAHPDLSQQDHARRVLAHHPPLQAGKIFARARPKLAALTHLVMLSDKDHPAPSLAQIVAETRETHGGPLIAGKDLMTYDIGRDGVATFVPD